MSADHRERDTGNWAPGAVLAGRYEILRRLGEGDVYAAFDRELEADIAVRRVPLRRAGDPEALERLKRELHRVRALSHPNLCRVYDWHTMGSGGNEEHFLTMELLHGTTLADALSRRRRVPARLAVPWLRDIAGGLDAAHAAGIAHGHLRPAHVVLAAPAGGMRAERRRAVITGLRSSRPEAAPGGDIAAFGRLARDLLGPRAAALTAACADSSRRPASAGAALTLLPARYGRLLQPRSPAQRRSRWFWAAGAAAAALALCLGLLRYYQVRSEVQLGASILLTPLVNATGQAEFDGAGAALRQQLAQSGQFELLDAGQTRHALARMEEPANLALSALAQRPALARQLAMRAHAPLVVFGELSRGDGRYRLEVELERVGHDPDAPARRWSDAETAANPAGVFRALHAAADWLRRRAGEPDTALAATDLPPEDITTSSWSALSLYARAE